jgi:pimeloyl-ACP methyl ester carboxylesterase
MTILYIIIILLVLFLFICIFNYNKEKFDVQTFQSMIDSVTGNTSTVIINLGNNRTTNLRKLLGNNGETIILLHNSPFDQQLWFPLFMYAQQMKNIGKKIPTLICYDLLGHGTAWESVPEQYNTSNPNMYIWNIQDFTNDLKKIYDQIVKTGKITIVGYGFGVIVGIDFCLTFDNLIKGLYILNNAIGPTETTVLDEYNYLVNWINSANKEITYLTMEQSFIQHRMCLWFELNDIKICPYPENRSDDRNMFNTVEYLFGDKMMREASATTHLQIGKLVRTLDYRQKLANSNLLFPITQLITNRDVYTVPGDMINDFNMYLKKATGQPTLYIASGKHGFVLTHPDYIFDLITGNDMSNNSLTLNKFTK